MSFFTSFRNVILTTLEIVSSAALWLVVMLLGGAAMERSILGTSYIGNADDLVGYSAAVLFAFGLALGLSRGAHVSIEILDNWLSARSLGLVGFLVKLLGIFSGLILLYGAIVLCVQSYQRGRMYYGSIEVQAWVVQLVIVVGAIAFVYEFMFGEEETDEEFANNT